MLTSFHSELKLWRASQTSIWDYIQEKCNWFVVQMANVYDGLQVGCNWVAAWILIMPELIWRLEQVMSLWHLYVMIPCSPVSVCAPGGFVGSTQWCFEMSFSLCSLWIRFLNILKSIVEILVKNLALVLTKRSHYLGILLMAVLGGGYMYMCNCM